MYLPGAVMYMYPIQSSTHAVNLPCNETTTLQLRVTPPCPNNIHSSYNLISQKRSSQGYNTYPWPTDLMVTHSYVQ